MEAQAAAGVEGLRQVVGPRAPDLLPRHRVRHLQDHRPLVPPALMVPPVPMGPTVNTLPQVPRQDNPRRHPEDTQAIRIKDIIIPRTANNSSSRRRPVDTRPRGTVPRHRAIPVTSTALRRPEEAIRTRGILRNKAGCRLVPRRVRPKDTGSIGKSIL